MSIRLDIVDGTSENIQGLLFIFSPAILLLILFFVYSFHHKPHLPVLLKLRKALCYLIAGILLFFLALFLPLLLPSNTQPTLDVFTIISFLLIGPFLAMVFPFLLIVLFATQTALWVRKKERN